MADRLERSPRELRDEVEGLIRADLVGPLGGETEELREAPADRYLLGLLAPRFGFDGRAAHGQNAADDGGSAADLLPEDDLAAGAVTADFGEEGSAEDRPAAIDQLVPSSFGMTFALSPSCTRLTIEARWGAYSRATSEEKLDFDGRPLRVWRRRPCGGERTVEVPRAGAIRPFAPDDDEPEVRVQGLIRAHGGHRLVTLFLVNVQQAANGRSVERWLVQAQLAVACPDGGAVFERRTLDPVALAPQIDREEVAGLEMLYRDAVELAVGHGIGVEATVAPGQPDRGVRIATAAMPAEEVPRAEAPDTDDFAAQPAIRELFARALEAMDMRRLAHAESGELQRLLAPLPDVYEAWIAAQAARVNDPAARLEGHEEAAERHLAAARTALRRIREGIAALTHPDVAEAFRFANHAMWQQRVHTIAADARRRDDRLRLAEAIERADVPRNRSWRPFQLAFVLLNLPAMADPHHPERTRTGASSTCCSSPPAAARPRPTSAHRVHAGDPAAAGRRRRTRWARGRRGADALHAAPAHAATVPARRRAAVRVRAAPSRPLRRRADGRAAPLGPHAVAHRTVGRAGLDAQPHRGRCRVGPPGAPAQRRLARLVAAAAHPLPVVRRRAAGRTRRRGRTRRAGGRCCRARTPAASAPSPSATARARACPPWWSTRRSTGLFPTLVIATVDKFARMPWEGRSQALFGRVSRHCERHGFLTPDEKHPGSHPRGGGEPPAAVHPCEPLRPPDLIIQDELHLISGPLGSLVGLYETAVDELATWTVGGRRVRPKVIASTATIRRAGDQVARLFARRLAVFPPPGLDARDSFFALDRDRPEHQEAQPGRRYLGICAPGRRFKHVLIRAYVAQLRAAWIVLGRQPGPAADAYMTLVGYFNSLRELGGMRRLVEDDVQSRLFRTDEHGRGRLIIEELTSRKSAAEIPSTLDQLGVERLSPDKRVSGGRSGRYQPLPIDVLLATNMISVGVDVQRLGVMVVAGQPKSTSEYIQATSRVGRKYPGLVLAVYNWARPRDLSHFETFGHYHRTFYRQVEALSVTPFAPRALDRGLTGVLAALLRLSWGELNDNAGAGRLDPADPRVARVCKAIRARAAGQLDHPAAVALEERLEELLDAWRKEASVGQRTLVYKRRGKSDTDVSLLEDAGRGSVDHRCCSNVPALKDSIATIGRSSAVTEIWRASPRPRSTQPRWSPAPTPPGGLLQSLRVRTGRLR